MEQIFILAAIALCLLTIPTFLYKKVWSGSINNLLFANRSLKMVSSALAINSHWFWAIAIFVSPAVAYNWGIIGLLWFVIPNALSLIVVGFLSRKIRNDYPDGYSLTEIIQSKYGFKVTSFYYLMYLIIALAGILLGFTALFKFFTFIGAASPISPIFMVLIFGLITLVFTTMGGIRTSILTGSIQTVSWILFLSFVFFSITFDSSGFLMSTGKNELTTIFDIKFLTTYAIAFLVTIIVGATSHGMMWQKSFSMSKENILPSYGIAAVIFAVMVFMMGSLGLYAFDSGLSIKTPDTSQLTTISNFGTWSLVVFGILLIGQTSTVIDSCLNYISSVVTREGLNTDKVWIARLTMIVFFMLAWTLTFLKLEVWTIFMLMVVLRISMFMPLVGIVNDIKLNQRVVFYTSTVAVLGSLYMSWLARIEKMPIYDMYSALFALSVGTIMLSYAYIKTNSGQKQL
jgi:Na+/proline symporter